MSSRVEERTGESSTLLAVRDLRVTFLSELGEESPAVRGVDFEVRRGETLGLLGESGCGKSVTALSILGLLGSPRQRVTGCRVTGEIWFEGVDLLQSTPAELRAVRGRRVGMVFQDPTTALNPVFRVGEQIAETLRAHRRMDRRAARSAAVEWLERVGIADPESRADDYPHQLSGGMRQRVLLAMAMSCGPELLIADEPTTALDVTVQAQILEIVGELKREQGTSVLLITHDLSVIAENADRAAVMYAGEVVESATTDELFRAPRHPYTRGLLQSLPGTVERGERLRAIPGVVPSALERSEGCRFRPRCPIAEERCEREAPRLAAPQDPGEGRLSACHFPEKVPAS